ncbi:membrane protein insertion efficiency factor YidD [Methylorubrum sp. Q1]|uniref:membrane protein insertion efficiency factor YidD n=1 Tax=Methylorubrum sp. Q1 TaxID=2562453 RepID=UPI0010768DAC|nr:membrane protein insertion efficiency factor YidD [Methylorubrum sp. Q1]TFZ61405.1 membrane protein insertion efficiency factor YidD [Methylorubrum sp. Q1]
MRQQEPGRRVIRRAAHGAIRAYQLTLSGLIGRQCRHWPSCSAYTDEAIQRHGLWAGGWIGFARLCRCGPFGTHGIDLVPEHLPESAVWHRPWSYGRWRGVEAPPPLVCEAVEERCAASGAAGPPAG